MFQILVTKLFVLVIALYHTGVVAQQRIVLSPKAYGLDEKCKCWRSVETGVTDIACACPHPDGKRLTRTCGLHKVGGDAAFFQVFDFDHAIGRPEAEDVLLLPNSGERWTVGNEEALNFLTYFLMKEYCLLRSEMLPAVRRGREAGIAIYHAFNLNPFNNRCKRHLGRLRISRHSTDLCRAEFTGGTHDDGNAAWFCRRTIDEYCMVR